jgi:superfamily II DNA or RNA helicase
MARGNVRVTLRGNDLLIAPVASAAAAESFAAAPAGPGGDGRHDGASALRAPLTRAVAELAAPGTSLLYDQRLGAYRTLPAAYRAIHERLAGADYDVSLGFDPAPALPFTPAVGQSPRAYQQAALDAWAAAGHRGVVVLPTGAGKTLVALLAIARLRVHTLIVVPTIDLLEQWRAALVEVLRAPPEYVRTFGGGKQALGPLTVMTYDSAAIHTRELNRFGLLVFDEVHHLPATSYRRAAEGAVAPCRLGLSATPDRADGRDADLAALVGPVVFARSPDELAAHLAAYRERRIHVALSPDEQQRYEAARAAYRDYVRRRRLRITSPEDFQRLVIWPSANDPQARAAMLAHREARRLAFNSAGKLAALVGLLGRHATDRVIIFSEYNAVVDQISRQLLIPSITHRTPPAERAAVLAGFRAGRFTKLVTGRVLNEGVDVPDANVAIVLSGTAMRREYVQRLGRVLRPKTSPAVLYELVSEETDEMHVTRRRHGRPGPSESGSGR